MLYKNKLESLCFTMVQMIHAPKRDFVFFSLKSAIFPFFLLLDLRLTTGCRKIHTFSHVRLRPQSAKMISFQLQTYFKTVNDQFNEHFYLEKHFEQNMFTTIAKQAGRLLSCGVCCGSSISTV